MLRDAERGTHLELRLNGQPAPELAVAAVFGLLALRTSDGTTLWHAGSGRVGTPPITYELDGRQYVVMGGNSSLYAFVLPK